MENPENLEIHRIPQDNPENHKNLRFRPQNVETHFVLLNSRTTKILKILEFHLRIIKINNNLKFLETIMKIIQILEFYWRINTNHGNLKIPCQNLSKLENLRITLEN